MLCNFFLIIAYVVSTLAVEGWILLFFQATASLLEVLVISVSFIVVKGLRRTRFMNPMRPPVRDTL